MKRSRHPGSLGQWELLQLVKRGKKSESWRAFSRRHGIEGHAKVSRIALDDLGGGAEIFFEEGFTTIYLDVPMAPKPVSMGVAGGYPYMVHPLLDAVSLRVRINQWAASHESRGTRSKVARQLVQLVRTIHSKGVYHRDIKPDNTLLGQDGRLYLIDWALAYAPELRPGARYRTGKTPQYSGPERLQRKIHSGEADDVFSLGVTLIEILADRWPLKPSAIRASDSENLPIRDAQLARSLLGLTAPDPGERIAAFEAFDVKFG